MTLDIFSRFSDRVYALTQSRPSVSMHRNGRIKNIPSHIHFLSIHDKVVHEISSKPSMSYETTLYILSTVIKSIV